MLSPGVTLAITPPEKLSDRFTFVDYLVFVAMLVLSATIGIFYAFRGVHKIHEDYMMGGLRLTCGPVVLLLMASFMLANTVLGVPEEVYRFGMAFSLFTLAHALMVIISAEVVLPIYYRLGITSAYKVVDGRHRDYKAENVEVIVCAIISYRKQNKKEKTTKQKTFMVP